MDDNYTPTTEEVETHWVNVGFAGDRASFRRWLAAHDAEVAATALEHAAEWIEGVVRPTRTASERLRKYAAEYRRTETEASHG